MYVHMYVCTLYATTTTTSSRNSRRKKRRKDGLQPQTRTDGDDARYLDAIPFDGIGKEKKYLCVGTYCASTRAEGKLANSQSLGPKTHSDSLTHSPSKQQFGQQQQQQQHKQQQLQNVPLVC